MATATLPLLRPSLLRHPLKPLQPKLPHRPHLKFPPPPQSTKPIIPLISASASYTPIPATDRLLSVASYCFPLFNGLPYGRFVFLHHPVLSVPFKPLLPLAYCYRSIPFASFISFFAFYLGIVRNPSASRYVRLNALQALIFDVILVVPVLIEQVLSPGLTVTVLGYNCLFTVLVTCFSYALGCSVLGKTPSLPLVSEAAERQLNNLDYS
ncbi:hypothetical protein ACH5RR_018642 [Cinchona calisaya]|uniref:Protein TIC 20 n=1 Tax=Cinchona calisaya TaxID=153742 RepID=A0ABD2ZNA5_9GENT